MIKLSKIAVDILSSEIKTTKFKSVTFFSAEKADPGLPAIVNLPSFSRFFSGCGCAFVDFGGREMHCSSDHCWSISVESHVM